MVKPERRAEAAQKIFAHEARLEARRDRTSVRPGFRERVEELLRTEWHEPVVALRLGDTEVGFAVPGRRLDGTVRGRRRVRRCLWNVLRGAGGAVLFGFGLANGAVVHPFRREIRVTGPADAMALGLLDALRPARGPWLGCSPSGVAVVDTGPTRLDPADAPEPRILWQARKPQAPEVRFRGHTLIWPDGSSFRFPLHGRTEEQRLREHLSGRAWPTASRG